MEQVEYRIQHESNIVDPITVPSAITVFDFLRFVENEYPGRIDSLHYDSTQHDSSTIAAGKSCDLQALPDKSVLMMKVVPACSTLKLNDFQPRLVIPELRPGALGFGRAPEPEELRRGASTEDELTFIVKAKFMEQEIIVDRNFTVECFIDRVSRYFHITPESTLRYPGNPGWLGGNQPVDLRDRKHADQLMTDLLPNGSTILLDCDEVPACAPRLVRELTGQSTPGSPDVPRLVRELTGQNTDSPDLPSLVREITGQNSPPNNMDLTRPTAREASTVPLEQTWIGSFMNNNELRGSHSTVRGDTLKILQEALGCGNPFCASRTCGAPDAKPEIVAQVIEGLDLASEDISLGEAAGYTKSMRLSHGWVFPSCSPDGLDTNKLQEYKEAGTLTERQLYERALQGKGGDIHLFKVIGVVEKIPDGWKLVDNEETVKKHLLDAFNAMKDVSVVRLAPKKILYGAKGSKPFQSVEDYPYYDDVSDQLIHKEVYSKTYLFEDVKTTLNKLVDAQLDAWKRDKYKYAEKIPADRENDERYKVRTAAIMLARYQCKDNLERLPHIERVKTIWFSGYDPEFRKFDTPASALGIEDTGQLVCTLTWADCQAVDLSTKLEEIRLSHKLQPREMQRRLYIKDALNVLIQLPVKNDLPEHQFPLEVKLREDHLSNTQGEHKIERADVVIYHLRGEGIPAGTKVSGRKNMPADELKRLVHSALGAKWPIDEFVIRELWGRKETEVHVNISKTHLKQKHYCSVCGKELKNHTTELPAKNLVVCQACQDLKEALVILDQQPDDDKETCYKWLLKIVTDFIGDPKKQIKSSSKVLREKIFEVPGGESVFIAAGFRKTGENFVNGEVELLREVQAILLAHIRAFLVTQLRQRIDQYHKLIAWNEQARDEFLKGNHLKISTSLEGIVNMCDFTRSVKDKVDGAVESFKVTGNAQVASRALQVLLNSFVELAFRTFAYDDDELCYSTPSVFGQHVGRIAAGENVLLIRDGRKSEWTQVLQPQYPDRIAHARGCRLENSHVCSVFLQADDSEVFPLMMRASDRSEAPADDRLSILMQKKTELQEELDSSVNMLKAARMQLEQANTAADRVNMEGKIKTCESEVAKLESGMQLMLQDIQTVGMIDPQAWSADVQSTAPVAIELSRNKTRAHPVFENRRQATCWLSCLFQALWHAPVFQYAFDCHYLRTFEHMPDDEPPILTTFRQTWALAADPSKPLDPEPLAKAMGVAAFGDSSEALGSLVGAFESSPHPMAKAIAKGIIPCVSVHLLPSSPVPTPVTAWTEVCEMKAETVPLIAVEITLEEVGATFHNDQIGAFAEVWYPRYPELAHWPDLGRSHKVVAIICFLQHKKHYTVFCARRSDPKRVRFFNDLPDTTIGAPVETDWSVVPAMCNQFGMLPRFILYESTPNVSLALQEQRNDACVQM